MIKAAVDRAGVIYNAEDALQEEVRPGKLEIILKPFAASSVGFHLCCSKESHTPSKVRAFIEHVKAQR